MPDICFPINNVKNLLKDKKKHIKIQKYTVQSAYRLHKT